VSAELWNRIKGAAAAVQMQGGQNRWGLVTSVRASDQGYDARVLMQPEDIMSAWLPVLSSFGGPGFGIVSRPSLGMQVMVAPDVGDGHHGIIVGMAYNTTNPAPKPPNGFQQSSGTPVDDGEFAVVSKGGAVFRLCSDGSIYMKATALNLEGNLMVQGNITASAGANGGGDISDRHGSLDRLRGVFDRHNHGTGPGPNQTDPE
jgi:phage baseplate assembly protein gpV